MVHWPMVPKSKEFVYSFVDETFLQVKFEGRLDKVYCKVVDICGAICRNGKKEKNESRRRFIFDSRCHLGIGDALFAYRSISWFFKIR